MADDNNNQEEATPPKNPSFFESQTFRLITLGLYLTGLSGMGMTLAFYHIFLWDSKMPPLPAIKPHHPYGG